MPELNKANRQVCDVDIRILKTKAPFLFFDTANTTTAGLTGDAVYAMKKGTQAVAFQNPIAGTMTIEAQVVPFKMYALLSDGTIHSNGIRTVKKDITCSTAGQLTITVAEGDTVKSGTVFVYPVGSFGDEKQAIAGSFADNTKTFKANKTEDLAVGTAYEVGYIVNRNSGVNRVSFATNKVPKDYFISMNTVDKDEEGTLTPFIMTAYKASIQRSFDLSFSSEGDPASFTLTFDLLEDKDGNVLDILEDVDAAE